MTSYYISPDGKKWALKFVDIGGEMRDPEPMEIFELAQQEMRRELDEMKGLDMGP